MCHFAYGRSLHFVGDLKIEDMSQDKPCMHEEETQAALNISVTLDIPGMPSQGYAGDNATLPWHKQAGRKGDGC